ncbi:ABC transporter ATP-binding protein [uncultured Ilyobacter sp.]|uniref:ABC transporter ATP-binding protein n=1 Tax=uncultured Ilyobacter sp. TaxID=544433 RepID=UPI0029C638C9|nr:ABC transporter ATP-binding protein [uncultured Ilyobacter sp.]
MKYSDRENVIEINKLEKTYITGEISLKALDNVSFTVKKGEFVAIMGPSGSGKSTMMNILGCLDQTSVGEYRLSGVNIEYLDDDQLAEIRNKKIGFVFQAFNLLPKLRAWENVALPLVYAGVHAHHRKELAVKALEDVGLGDRIDHKPNELSGGQRQRAALARALVTSPSIILADEPTGNLDSKSEEEVLTIFKELNQKGVTIVMVTHEDGIAAHCKRIIRFRDGKLIKDEVIDNEFYRDL